MGSLDILLNILIHPYYAFRRGDKSLCLSLAVVIVAIWSATVSNYVVRGSKVNPHLFTFGIVIQIILTLFLILLAVSLWHLVGELFKGKGRVRELFPSICLSFLPYIFLAPASLIAGYIGGASVQLFSFFKFLIVLWVIVLQIFSIKTIYELTGPLTILSYFTPALLTFGIFILLFLLMILLLAIVTSEAVVGLLPALNL